MKRETFLTIAIIALLLLNLGTLAYLFLMQPRPHYPIHESVIVTDPEPGPPDVMLRELKFDSTQNVRFDSLKHSHREKIILIDSQYEKSLQKYFSRLALTRDSAEQWKDSLEKSLASLQLEKISTTFEHLKALQELCSPQQKAKFDSLLPGLVRNLVMSSPHPIPEWMLHPKDGAQPMIIPPPLPPGPAPPPPPPGPPPVPR